MELENLPAATDPAGWTPDDLSQSESWRHSFTKQEIMEVLAAAREPVGLDETSGEPRLSVLAPEIQKTLYELTSGLGFRVLHGLPVDELGQEGTEGAFMAISRQIGEPMLQPAGAKLAHVRLDPKGRQRIGFRTAGELPFHADLEDVIGFLCIRPASQGGTRKFVSAVTVYNIMREAYRDQLRVLIQPFCMELRHPHPDSGRRWTLLPFVKVQDNTFNACAFRINIKRAQILSGVPEISAAQADALETFNAVADDVAVSMELRPGDIEYYNNHVVLHTRTRFADNQPPGRHLLRVWLAMNDFRTLHEEHPIRLRARTEGSAPAS